MIKLISDYYDSVLKGSKKNWKKENLNEGVHRENYFEFQKFD